ncbi:MAG: hypothetical protein HY255_13135 [Betaproteobacteria bacterium]|nr:hypothetical protein [Betaproteobacteria bacterium]
MNKSIIACLVFSSTLALAQDRPPPPDGRAPPDIAKILNIDAKRADKVQEILRAAHEQRIVMRKSTESGGAQGDRKAAREKMRTLREETDRKLAAVLTPDEMKKLQAAMPPPPPDGPQGKPPGQ